MPLDKLTMVSSTLAWIDDDGCHEETVTTTNDTDYSRDPNELMRKHTIDVFDRVKQLKDGKG